MFRSHCILPVSDHKSNGVRQRHPQDEGDIDAVLKHQRKVQERLAEELLHHTLNLKDFAYASSSIVKKDIEVRLKKCLFQISLPLPPSPQKG